MKTRTAEAHSPEYTNAPALPAIFLTILGIFRASIMDTGRFVRMIGKEPLIVSDLVSYLIEDTVNERVQTAVTTAVAEVEERQWEWLTHDVEDVLVARFPVTPVALATVIRGMKDHERPQDLHAVLLRAPDQQAAEHLLRQAAE